MAAEPSAGSSKSAGPLALPSRLLRCLLFAFVEDSEAEVEPPPPPLLLLLLREPELSLELELLLPRTPRFADLFFTT